jgi:adenylylsulfate kinase-like enzyme
MQNTNYKNKIFWLTGNSGAGKTSLAKGLQQRINNSKDLLIKAISLDGDELRASISTEEGFSREDRRRHNLRVARLAKLLAEQDFLVIVSVIAPFESLRQEISEICKPIWIYVKKDNLNSTERPYEEPQTPDLIIDNNLTGQVAGLDFSFDFVVSLLS